MCVRTRICVCVCVCAYVCVYIYFILNTYYYYYAYPMFSREFLSNRVIRFKNQSYYIRLQSYYNRSILLRLLIFSSKTPLLGVISLSCDFWVVISCDMFRKLLAHSVKKLNCLHAIKELK